ncbi:MAG: hypothetical protein JSV26_03865 [bacterium]|nr:MAG: hypothetical protein JSV26_03865 [bacterium]
MASVARKTLIMSVVLLMAASCAPTLHLSLGEIPAADPGKHIRAGVTSRQEVLDTFGQPDLEGFDKEGLPTWTYTRMSVQIVKAKEATMTEFFNLEISFRDDVVQSFSYDLKAGKTGR